MKYFVVSLFGKNPNEGYLFSNGRDALKFFNKLWQKGDAAGLYHLTDSCVNSDLFVFLNKENEK